MPRLDPNEFNHQGYAKLTSAVAELDTPAKREASKRASEAGSGSTATSNATGAALDQPAAALQQSHATNIAAGEHTIVVDSKQSPTIVAEAEEVAGLDAAVTVDGRVGVADPQLSSSHAVLLQHASVHVDEAEGALAHV